MDMETFLDLSKRFNDLGWAVQDQFIQLDQGVDPETLNPNALRMIASFLTYAAKQGLEGTDILLDAIEAGTKETE